ncbi:MAG: hypothetical protein K2K53_03090 [Oscillospiraceae bacterium]|nr:hypothetical protein [Oscillospiraceae bacterium]
MKIWKALGIAALAAVVPVRFQKDEETGKKTFQSLLWKLDGGPVGDGEETEIGLDLMEGVLTAPLMKAITARREAELFTDDPEEAVLFADDDPGAALVEAAEVVQDAADEVVEAVVEAADEAAETAREAVEEVVEAAEADFEPGF